MNPEMEAGLKAILGPEMAQIIIDTQAIAGYELPIETQKGFLFFHEFVTDPVPGYIAKWRASPTTEHCCHRPVNGILGDVHSAVRRVFYHRGRMMEIEDTLLQAIESVDYKSRLGNAVFALGNTPKWDFEYQAFVLATRSALDYLRRALSAYFHDKSHSYNSWPKALRHPKAPALARALLETYEAQQDGLFYLKQNLSGVARRDQIAHHGHVSPATINLTAKGLVLVGGGEDLAFNREVYHRGPKDRVAIEPGTCQRTVRCQCFHQGKSSIAGLFRPFSGEQSAIKSSSLGFRLPPPQVFSIAFSFASATQMSLTLVILRTNCANTETQTSANFLGRSTNIVRIRFLAEAICALTNSSIRSPSTAESKPPNISTEPDSVSRFRTFAADLSTACCCRALYSVSRNVSNPASYFVPYVRKKCGRSIVGR